MRLKYVILGTFVGVVLAATTNVIMPWFNRFQLLWLGPPLTLTWLGSMVYAITRYRLMDINVAVTRATVFAIVYASLLGLPMLSVWVWQSQLEQALGQRWWAWFWVTGVGLATAAHYANLYFQREAERRLLREQHRYQQVLLSASSGMTQIRELKRLLDLIVHVITKTVGLTHAAIFLYDPKEEVFALRASRYARFSSQTTRVPSADPMIELLRRGRQPFVLAELKAQVEGRAHHDGLVQKRAWSLSQMRALNASVLVPSFMQEQLVGFLVLGEKRRGHIFTTDDLTVFTTLANQAALAIDNAQFYEELQNTQAQLFQAAKMASLGQMGAGMSHQINNRFQALLGSTGQLLYVKLPKLLDDPQLTPAQREKIEQFARHLESVEKEAVKGGEIVRTLTKYARASTEQKLLSLSEILSGALSLVQYKINLGEVDYVNGLPEHAPKVRGTLSQLQDVFFNLIDNAYDAIKIRAKAHEKGPLPPAPGYRGSIRIAHRILPDAHHVEIAVQDNGIGMTKEEAEQLFVPFFTTKATAEKGTGLGLFVIKKVLEIHSGTIEVQSAYGKGSTFAVRLPIAQETPISAPAAQNGAAHD